MSTLPRLVIAAPATGAGKTTVAVALMRLLRERGLRVAPFKAGPDYIDPTHHRAAAGRDCRNLDSWLVPHDTLRALLRRATSGPHAADIAIVEGMMGLFDGFAGESDAGSTAELARLLAAPLVLVLDVSTAGRTAAAVVHGLHTFDPQLRLAGVVLNRAGGEAHYAACRAAVEQIGVPVLGWLPNDAALTVPERHLGLLLAGERSFDFDRLLACSAVTLDVDAILRIANAAQPLPDGADPLPPPVGEKRAVIAVARDAAFDFYYQDNLDLLADLGAEIRSFSPLEDERLPEAAGALYLGGGYPELHAERLFTNLPMRRAIRAFAASARPVYAECGGLMYLSEALVDASGARHRMIGLVPCTSRMQDAVTLGYREIEALHDSPLASRGERLRGHEFHYSTLDSRPPRPAYRRAGGDEIEGAIAGPRANVLASYIHLHFASDPRLAERFVAAAAAGE